MGVQRPETAVKPCYSAHMNDLQRHPEASWLYDKLGRREQYHLTREDLLQHLADHAEHVRLVTMGELIRLMDDDRGLALRYVACWREVKAMIAKVLYSKAA